MAGFIATYEEAVSLGPALVGGKGWNLARLHRYGFLVPAGGILITQAYRQFMQEPTLQASCAALASREGAEVTSVEVTHILDNLRTALEATPLSALVEDAVHTFLAEARLADVPVAVRSSASTEDGAISSFAGIHESFLHVQGEHAILQAIKGCYGSLWTPRALAYRRQKKLADEDIACAVVICQMVSGPENSLPVAAGVAFSCDPRTGQRDRVCINAAPGWGDVVASGQISPEVSTVVQRTDGEPLRVEVERLMEGPQVLSSAQAVTLAALVQRVHWALGEGQDPQDVEWAYDGAHFWLVQARPVTHLPRVSLPAGATLPPIWSNANLKDIMPDVLTPLSWSLLQPIVSVILYAPCQEVHAALPEGLEVMRRFSGRAYFDLTTMLLSYCDTFGLLPQQVTRGMGGHQPDIPVPSQHPLRGWAGPRRILARLRLLRAIARTERTLQREMLRLRTQARAYTQQSLTALSSDELLARLLQLHTQTQAFGHRFQLANMGGVWTDYLTHLLEQERPDQAQAISAGLMTGSRAVESAEHGYQLYEVALAATEDSDARSYLAEPAGDPNGWQSLPEHSPFRQAFTSFLETYGHRGVYEFELANPRWNENQAYLLDCIRVLCAQAGLTVPYDLARQKRRAAEAEVARLPLRLRPFVAWFAHQARRAAAAREAGKSTLIALLEPMRALLLELGRRLAAAHLLEDQEAIFFLAWCDLVALLRGEWDGTGGRALAADRQAQHDRWSALIPADVIIGDREGQPASSRAADGHAMEAARLRHASHSRKGETLHGIAASPGQVTGRARILHHPNEGRSLQAGEVLVAPSTDPGWTPLFLRAGAIVMETGGYLSHGAIVAREFGIPAVVNIPGLLEQVEEGQVVTVDGSRGHVILGEAANTARHLPPDKL